MVLRSEQTIEEAINKELLLLNILKSRSPAYTLPFSIGNNKEICIAPCKICYVESDGVSSRIHFYNQKETSISIALSIGECEEILRPYAFLRIHRSYLLNYSFIKDFQLEGESQVNLVTDISLRLARRRKKSVLKYFEEMKKMTFTL